MAVFGKNEHSRETAPVLFTSIQFRKWFLERYDFSCFTERDIQLFFEDEQPTEFPCIPMFDKKKSLYPAAYISVRQVNEWVSDIGDLGV